MSSLASALKLENVVYEKKGPIAYVTLNRPKVMNALNKATINELRVAFEDARDDSAVRGVILTGAGRKAFAAGADISEIVNNTAVEAEEATRSGTGLTDLIENLGKPVVAAVNGFALGGGCELAMACTIASLPRARNSVSPKSSLESCPATEARSVCRVWWAKAEHSSSSCPATSSMPAEAYRIGLVDEVVPTRQSD